MILCVINIIYHICAVSCCSCRLHLVIIDSEVQIMLSRTAQEQQVLEDLLLTGEFHIIFEQKYHLC